jgi:hypothetical protein
MPRQGGSADAQFVFRGATAEKVELDAIAKTLDRSSADILREVLGEALPKLRERAEREQARRDHLPHGITPDDLDRAVTSLLRKLAQGEPVHIEQHDLLSAQSKALWVVLGFLWGESATDVERAAASALKSLAEGKPPLRPRR